jgi:putative ABC transport system permease protein
MKARRILSSGMLLVRRHILRTFLMMLGIVVGITALTVILALAAGTEENVMKNVEKMFAANNIMIGAGGGMMGGGRGDGPTTTLEIADFEALAAEIPNIELWDPQHMFNREVEYKDQNAEVRIFAHSPSAEILRDRSVTSGSFFSEEHMKQGARVVLIGETARSELFGDEDPLDAQVRIGGVPFRVIGVLESMGVDAVHGMDRDRELYVPITTAQRRLLNIDYVSSGTLQVADAGKMAETADRVKAVLRERHSITEGEQDDFYVITPLEVQQMVRAGNRMFNLFLPLVAGVAILVGTGVVATLMLISVNERTGEIGLRKAVGARPQDIVLQFVAETTFVTLIAGILGIVLGLVAARAVGGMLGIPASVSLQPILVGVVLSALAGIVAATLPARRAAAVDPIETLR